MRKSQFDKRVAAYGATWERYYLEHDNSYTIMVDAPEGYMWAEGGTNVIVVNYFPDFNDRVADAYAEAVERMAHGLTPNEEEQ